MDEKKHGGAWSIQPPTPKAKPTKPRRVNKTVHIKDMLLKELLKKRSVAIEKIMIDTKTGQEVKHTEVVNKSTVLIIFDSIMNDMVYHSDIRMKQIGIKLLIDLLAASDNLIYHPSVLAKIDIDQLCENPEEKELFMLLLQKTSQTKRLKEITQNKE